MIISRSQLQPNEFKNMTLLNHTKAEKENLVYRILKSSAFKSKNYKTITVRETVPMITGIDVELQIFGVYYLYSRAVISGKVTQVYISIKKIFNRKDKF